MIRQITLAALLAGFSAAARAQTMTALPDSASFADPHCAKPQMNLVNPGVWNNSDAVNSYNLKVRKFNQAVTAYDSCMRAYIDKANRDVKAIQEKANADLKQITERANASMKVIQDKIGQAVADAKSVGAALDQETAKLRQR